jgi:hypothetical protein|uniref:Uncharacterized protein n=1 Tax=Leviviridae sp. TaxID=2027243 RepID=A0A514D260_9VIRU|nr:MAG: hypothetical protein H1Bulk28FD59_000004 [Leviviridae sp.]
MTTKELEALLKSADISAGQRKLINDVLFWMKIMNVNDSQKVTDKITAIRIQEQINE